MALPRLLDDDSIDAAIEAAQATSHGTGTDVDEPASVPEWRFVRHLNSAVDPLVDALQNTEGRLMWGIRDLDLMMRGVGNGDLCFVTGRAHSGKTQLVMQAICNNAHGRFILFTPDEMAELVLMKLAAIMRGLNPEHVEQALKAGDNDMVELLRTVAADDFPNLVVIDDGLDFDDMRKAVMECEAYWEAPTQGIFIDYLELIPGDADHDGVTWKVQELKRFAKGTKRPVVCLHQGKRGERGQAKGMDGMRYGGENEATYVVEVFRKCQDESLDAYEREAEQNSITVGVVKNKRPPSKTGYVDLHIAAETGAIRPMQEGDRYVRPDDGAGPTQSRAEHNAAALQALKDEVAATQPAAEGADRPMF